MESLTRDLRFALRVLRKSPAFAAAAIVCLALAIGANTAVFSILDAVLLRGLPYRQPDRIFMLFNQFLSENETRDELSLPEVLDLQEQTRSFSEIAATRSGLFNLTGDGDPQLLVGVRVTVNLFQLLGVRAAHGRTFLPDEQQPGHEQVVVLSHELWARHFGSDPGVVGRKLTIDGKPFLVIGVMPAGFYFHRKGRDLWMPMAVDRAKLPRRGDHSIDCFARLKNGATARQAQSELTATAMRFANEHSDTYPPKSGYGMRLSSFREEIVGQIRPAILLLTAAVGLVLLIACANVANLLLARATTRAREVAVRTALGAGRGALIRQFLTESVLLAAGGGALGLLLAWWGVAALSKINLAKVPRIDEVSIDGWVLAFTLLVSLATGVLFGLVPALHASRADFHLALKEGGKGSAGAGKQLARRVLVVLEVAVALVVLVGAGLMIKSFRQLERVNPGFDSRSVLTLELFLPASKYPEKTQQAAFFSRLIERFAALPGVLDAAGVNAVPLGKVQDTEDINIEGVTLVPGEPNPNVGFRTCTPDYFRAMGIPVLAGRPFTNGDGDQSEAVAIVDKSIAQQFWPGRDPLGRHLKVLNRGMDGWRTVVGVVSRVKHEGLEGDSPPQVYLPATQSPQVFLYLVLRTGGDPDRLAPPARQAVRELDRDQAIFRVESMADKVAQNLAWRRFYTLLLGVFAGIALVLAMVGVYGVMAYSVAQRSREIGIRMALGAQRSSVTGMVVGQGLLLAGSGVVLGLLAALALTRIVKSLLYGVTATDLTTFAAVTLLLAALAMVASYFPAHKASKVDPMLALRSE